MALTRVTLCIEPLENVSCSRLGGCSAPFQIALTPRYYSILSSYFLPLLLVASSYLPSYLSLQCYYHRQLNCTREEKVPRTVRPLSSACRVGMVLSDDGLS